MPENWCKEHKAAWFKKGNMKGFAHPVLDDNGEPTGQWCNKPKESESVESGPSQGKSGMTPEQWNERDRTTRQSIHRQSASQRGVDILVQRMISLERLSDWVGYFFNYYETGQWGPPPTTGLENRPEVAEVPDDTTQWAKALPDAPTTVAGMIMMPPLKDYGELMFRCGRNGITPTNACKLLGVVNVKELPADMTADKAWLTIIEKCGKKELKP